MTPDMRRLCEVLALELGHHRPEDAHDLCEGYVRTVLKELREVSKPMTRSMCKAMSPGRRPTPERVSVVEKHRIRFQAAIDAVLEGS